MDLSHGGTDDEQVLVDQGNVHSWNLNEITVHHLHQENTSETKLPVRARRHEGRAKQPAFVHQKARFRRNRLAVASSPTLS
jgi:hypothetical protein